MNEEQIRKIIREELAHFMTQSKFVFNRPIQIQDGNDIVIGQSHGTRIGTSSANKIGFFGVEPREQIPAGVLIQRTGGAVVDNEARAGVADLNYALSLLGFSVFTP